MLSKKLLCHKKMFIDTKIAKNTVFIVFCGWQNCTNVASANLRNATTFPEMVWNNILLIHTIFSGTFTSELWSQVVMHLVLSVKLRPASEFCGACSIESAKSFSIWSKKITIAVTSSAISTFTDAMYPVSVTQIKTNFRILTKEALGKSCPAEKKDHWGFKGELVGKFKSFNF